MLSLWTKDDRSDKSNYHQYSIKILSKYQCRFKIGYSPQDKMFVMLEKKRIICNTEGLSEAVVESCSENMQQIYWRTPLPITLPRGSSPVSLLHIFRTPFTKNTSGWLLLDHMLISKLIAYGFDYSSLKLLLSYLTHPI